MGFSIILEKISGILASISIIIFSSIYLFLTIEDQKIFFFNNSFNNYFIFNYFLFY